MRTRNSRSSTPSWKPPTPDERRERLAFGFAKEAELALKLQTEFGYRILERGFRARGGELDLIAEERRENGAIELVLIEVRARREGGALESLVSPRKQKRLNRAARAYLAGYRGRAETIRWDAWVWEPEAGWRQAVHLTLIG